MKRIVDRKLYDTATAEHICAAGEVDLYRTQKGNWFIYGETKDMADYYDMSDICHQSDMIYPLSEQGVIDWLENNSTDQECAEALLKHFPEAVEEA